MASLLRIVIVFIVGASFIYLVVANFQSQREEEMYYSQLIRTTPWISWQLEREYFRFDKALSDYGAGRENIAHEQLILRFDILLSRIQPILTGSESEVLRNFDGTADFVEEFEAELLALEPLVTELASGDLAGAHAIQDRISAYSGLLQELSTKSVLGAEVGMMRESLAAAQARTQQLNTALILAAMVLVVLLGVEVMMSRRTMAREREARLEARRMAESNEQLSRRLESITEAVGVALYSSRAVGARQEIEYASANFASLVGRSPDFLGSSKDIVANSHPGDRAQVERALHRLPKLGRMSVEYRLGEGDDHLTWVSHTAVVTKHAGRGLETVGIIADVTEQRMANAVMEQNAKLITLGELATGLAHEINQPLSVIQMAAQNTLHRIVRRPDKDHGAYIQKKLQRIVDQTKRASRIIEQMRIFGRANPEEDGRSFVIDDAILAALDLTEQQLRLSGIVVVHKLDGTPHHVVGVQQKLEQVIINIILNARDAILERQQSAPGFAGEIRISINMDGDICTLEISDNAGGIREDIIDRLFDPFVTSKDVGKGTGLGLWIAFGFVAKMGGTISARNVDNGACFTITLPTYDPTAESHVSETSAL